MFKESDRYITNGVNEEVDKKLQFIMWDIIDKMKINTDIEVDYLQVFNIKKDGGIITIEQSQEVPEYKETYVVSAEGIELNEDTKVWVIDSEDYSTMLFPHEY